MALAQSNFDTFQFILGQLGHHLSLAVIVFHHRRTAYPGKQHASHAGKISAPRLPETRFVWTSNGFFLQVDAKIFLSGPS
jgi:hypothetical protein